tara:strand:+ start:203 stop:412 length:210 start_codon:yes stop_codon:yes gene_type:complete
MCEWTDTLAPSPSGDDVCSLSDILEATSQVPLRYYWSRKDCAHFLHRAERKGRALPPALLAALTAAAAG